MNKHTTEQRRRNMQAVKNKDSKIEITLRKALWRKGIRYRKNYNKVIGKPDIAMVGKKVAVFCDSEFWHGKNWEKKKQTIHSNRDFWINKIERNMERDIEVNESLTSEGWKVLRFWGKDIMKDTAGCIEKIVRVLGNE
jgi:DNA mismatch endonuclease Vsr